VWPDDIAAKVLATRPSDLDPVHNGTIDGLRRTMDDAGIDRAMCLGVASVPRTVMKTNEFIGSVDRTRFIPFGTVHPELPIEENLKSLRDNGIRGVKLHPLFQQLSFTDSRVIELMQALADANVIVITHAGSGGGEEANLRGAPNNLRQAIDAVPTLRVIACHFGGYHCLDQAEELLVGSRAFLETSWPPSVADLDPQRLIAIMRRHGMERIIFGSDWPMADPGREIATIRSFGLETKEEAGILGDNLATLLDLA
jgi:uncharacterized protein